MGLFRILKYVVQILASAGSWCPEANSESCFSTWLLSFIKIIIGWGILEYILKCSCKISEIVIYENNIFNITNFQSLVNRNMREPPKISFEHLFKAANLMDGQIINGGKTAEKVWTVGIQCPFLLHV